MRFQPISRRAALRGAAAASLLAAPTVLRAQPANVKLGILQPVTGALAQDGELGRLERRPGLDLDEGYRMAAAHDQVDFSPLDEITARQDLVAFRPKPEAGDPFGSPAKAKRRPSGIGSGGRWSFHGMARPS